MTKKNNLTPMDIDDKDLFREAMRDVAPLPAPDKTILTALRPKPMPRQKNACEQYSETDSVSDAFILEIDTGDEWTFLRPGVSRQTLRRLRRCYWPIQDSLDLHGFTQKAAKKELAVFLNSAQEKKFRCIKIIHGKGLSSKDRIPVLKKNLGNWLVQHQSVLAFCQARPENGGGGAVLVLLGS